MTHTVRGCNGCTCTFFKSLKNVCNQFVLVWSCSDVQTARLRRDVSHKRVMDVVCGYGIMTQINFYTAADAMRH